ncbi:MAG: hypothetical protein Q9179_004564 [Wetmoreana sp. 5 TL-2023]
MSETQELTLSDVASHNSKKDLYLVIHDKVYDATEFIDEHPYVLLPSPFPVYITNSLNPTRLYRYLGERDLPSSTIPAGLPKPRSRQGMIMLGTCFDWELTDFRDGSGGEEVLLDVGGQDATEAFEDVGHSDEAREILIGLHKGNLKRMPGDPEPSSAPAQATVTQPSSSDGGAGLGVMFYALVLVGVGVAFGAYKYLQANSDAGGK